jgi:DNA-binding NarL/FixJ family response regulator
MRSLLLIADDPATVRTMRVALRNAATFKVVATVDGRQSIRRRVRNLAPSVVVVDEMCQRTNAWARLREVREETPDATIVLLSDGLGTAAVDDALQAGADAVISANLPPAQLATLLRAVVEGNVVHMPRRRATARLRSAPSADPVPRLRAVADQRTSA